MRRVLAVCVLLAVGLGIALLIRQQYQPKIAKVSVVPRGDCEIAWIHTTTNGSAWERFIKGIFEAAKNDPEMIVNDSAAFLDQTAAVPEVVISFRDQPGTIRIRWYKISNEVSVDEWVNKLAERSPPPIAFIGGSSTDRAIDLAEAIAKRATWNGPKPLLCLTTATAEKTPTDANAPTLMGIHPDRTFRFCFSNKAMAKALLDFVGQTPTLRPHGPVLPSMLLSLTGIDAWSSITLAPVYVAEPRSRTYILEWLDEPYSMDLSLQFRQQLKDNSIPTLRNSYFDRLLIDSSVGTLNQANEREAEATNAILDDGVLRGNERVLVVLPAATQPVRRVIRELVADSPLIGRSMVAVTGDGISFNMTYRDGDVAWPIRELAIPLVFFAHQNPIAWEKDDPTLITKRTSTDDVLLSMDMTRILCKHLRALGDNANADDLRLRLKRDEFFTEDGERRVGSGEYIVLLTPSIDEIGRVSRVATFEVFTRGTGNLWKSVNKLPK